MAAEGSRFFFSYAREDSEIVLRLARELREAGANVWLDQLDIRGGSRWDEAIQTALESCQGLVAVLSPSSVASQNFLDEVSYALEEQKKVIPLLHRECAIPFRLRRLQYVNFTVNYDDGFAELLRSMGLEQIIETADLMAAPVSNRAAQPAVHREVYGDVATVGEEAKQRDEQETQRESDQDGDRESVDKALQREEPHRLPASMTNEKSAPVAVTDVKTFHSRKAGLLIGAIVGAVIGSLSCLFLGADDDKGYWLLGAFFSGIPCAIAGAIMGTNRRRIAVTLLAALVGMAIAALQEPHRKAFYALLEGLPFGAFFGAIVILLWSKAGTRLKRFKTGE